MSKSWRERIKRNPKKRFMFKVVRLTKKEREEQAKKYVFNEDEAVR